MTSLLILGLQVSVGWDESAIQRWIADRRTIVNQYAQGTALKNVVRLWTGANTHERELRRADGLKRNTAM